MRKETIQLTSRECIYEKKSLIYSEHLVPYQKAGIQNSTACLALRIYNEVLRAFFY